MERPARGMVEDRRAPARPVKRVEIVGHVLAHLAQGGQVARQDGGSHRQRLGHGHAIAFGERGHQQRACAAQQRRKTRIGAAVQFLDMADQRRAAFEHVDDLLVLPAPPPDHDQTRNLVRGQSFSQMAPEMEQQQVVLARLDRAQTDEIGRPSAPGSGSAGGSSSVPSRAT
jgi:hypothetical protein